jgi:hypothetical protein
LVKYIVDFLLRRCHRGLFFMLFFLHKVTTENGAIEYWSWFQIVSCWRITAERAMTETGAVSVLWKAQKELLFMHLTPVSLHRSLLHKQTGKMETDTAVDRYWYKWNPINIIRWMLEHMLCSSRPPFCIAYFLPLSCRWHSHDLSTNPALAFAHRFSRL